MKPHTRALALLFLFVLSVWSFLAAYSQGGSLIQNAEIKVVMPQSQSKAAIDAVTTMAAAAKAYCQAHNGGPPSGYIVTGDGPIIGPKQ